MRHVVPALLISLVLVAACKPVATATRAPSVVKRPAGTPASTAKPSVKPGAASAAPSPVALEPMTLLEGTLKVDAHYAVSAGGANVISAGGANVISAGGGNVISAGGGNVISAGGGNVISAGGANFRLAATPDVPLGTMLPAKGMGVVAVSLLTGEPVGEPVFTGDRGEYEVSVPERLKGQVLLVASMPGRSATDAVLKDARLHYPFLPAIVAGSERAGGIDEDTALVSSYARSAFGATLLSLMAQATSDFNPGPGFAAWLGEGSGTLVAPLLQELVTEMAGIKTPEMPLAARQALASRLGDLMAAEVDWAAANVDSNYPRWQGKPAEKAMAVFLDLMARTREAAAAKMADEPDFFAKQPWLVKANEGLAPEAAYAIRKPADLSEFLVRAYIGPNEPGVADKVRTVFAAVGLPRDQADRLMAAQYGVLTQVGLTLLSKPALKAGMLAMIREAGR